MPATDTSPPADSLLGDCLQQASAEGRHLMADLLTHTHRVLSQRDDGRSASITEALRQLDRHESALREGFPARLMAAFHRAQAGNAPQGVDADSLSLMDDTQLQESVESARAREAASRRLDGLLTELDALVCAARGLREVRRQDNPLRPEVCMGAVRDAVSLTGASSITQALWLRPMRAALDEGLAPLYTNIKGMLLSRGVDPQAATRSVAPQEVAGSGIEVIYDDAADTPRRRKLMLVDDDKAIVDYLAVKLGKDFDIVSTTNPATAVLLARTEQPDVILCDIDMPGMSGGEVATALTNEPRTAFIPLIYLTALATPAEMAELKNTVSGRPAVAKKAKLSELIDRINQASP